MGLVFTRIETEGRNGSRAALVVEPDGTVEISRARFQRMQAGEMHSRVDEEILDAVATFEGIQAVVFRARGPRPEDRWVFAADLGEEDCIQLASLFIRAHLELFRKLRQRGVVAMVGVDFETREAAAYHEGLDRLAEALQRELAHCRDEKRAAELRFGLWFAERQANWSMASLDDFVQNELADRIRTAERQLERLRSHGAHVAGPA